MRQNLSCNSWLSFVLLSSQFKEQLINLWSAFNMKPKHFIVSQILDRFCGFWKICSVTCSDYVSPDNLPSAQCNAWIFIKTDKTLLIDKPSLSTWIILEHFDHFWISEIDLCLSDFQDEFLDLYISHFPIVRHFCEYFF